MEYRIHPGIGIARLGNSESFFIGPEVPDPHFVPAGGKYRDDQQKIRRQGCRFRIYEYDDEGRAVREITDQEAEIRWDVHLANRKSFDKSEAPVPNDPGVKSIEGVSQAQEVMGNIFGQNVSLGSLCTDEKGRLVVIGAYGKTGKSLQGEPIDENVLKNPEWYDDTADGPVRATIRLRGIGETVEPEPAWVVTSVPAYASPILAPVTMYDLAYDIATRLRLNPLPPACTVSFTEHIYPVLRAAVMLQWVNSEAREGHSEGKKGNFLDPKILDVLSSNHPGHKKARERVYKKLRGADAPDGDRDMPQLAAGLQLTDLQLDWFKRWKEGDFEADWCGEPVYKPLEQLPVAEQPAALDKAGLLFGTGGSFVPGIEVGEAFAERGTYGRPFRIHENVAAGWLTKSLAMPWQVDFSACNDEHGDDWWPSARPTSVLPWNAEAAKAWAPTPFKQGVWNKQKMVEAWFELGFIHWNATAKKYKEAERLASYAAELLEPELEKVAV
jgi:hypothetical protein